MTLSPTQSQIDEGRVPLEHVRGSLDVSSLTVFSLVRYMVSSGIPMNARITAETFHDQPYLQLTWDRS